MYDYKLKANNLTESVKTSKATMTIKAFDVTDKSRKTV